MELYKHILRDFTKKRERILKPDIKKTLLHYFNGNFPLYFKLAYILGILDICHQICLYIYIPNEKITNMKIQMLKKSKLFGAKRGLKLKIS